MRKPKQPTEACRRRAQRNVEKAVDAMIRIQDSGLGCDAVARILELLNSLHFDD